ncbi:MAG: NCS2 family permease [Candidatus Ventricola sp.]
MLDRFFKLCERGTDVRTEFTAGLTAFFSMVYILMVNAEMFSNPLGDGSNPLGVSYASVYIATALTAVAGTLLVGLLANMPLAMAVGMGLNAFFVYTLCIGMGFTYANALVFVLIDGVIFIVLTVTGLRKRIFESIPTQVRTAISAGIGLFIAFLGLQNAGIVVADGATCVTLASFNLLRVSWGQLMPLVVTIAGFLVIAALSRRGVRGAVFWGLLGATALYYLLGLTVPGFYAGLHVVTVSPAQGFAEFAQQGFLRVVREGFDFSAYIAAHGSLGFALTLITSALALCMVDMFDTLGTLYAACERGGMVDSNSQIPGMDRAMLSDAIATVLGALCGVSTVTTFAESTAGVIEGGRTGLMSVFTAALFLLAMLLSPLAQMVPTCATAAVLIYVGVLMMTSVGAIDWSRTEQAVPAFLTMTIMPFTCNISYGIAFGMIAHVVISALTGRAREVRRGTWVLSAMFALMLLLTH